MLRFDFLEADGLFNFNSVHLGAAWYSDLSVAVEGFRDGVSVYSTVVSALTYTGSTLVNFGWTNLSVSAVPEPESYALMLTGLGLMGAITRRRKAGKSPTA